MMKKTTLLLLLCIGLTAQEFELKEIHFITENDADFRQDNDYTFGSEIGALFALNDSKKSVNTEHDFLSVTYDWKIYTPKDLERSDIIEDDRPYAGYQYIKTSLHRANTERLHTLALQVGFIGPDTKMQQVQNAVHSLIGSPYPNGWEHQLGNEFVMQLNYSYRKYMQLGKKSVVLPEVGFELGNASTKGYGMFIYRYGNDIAGDFGSSLIDNTNYYKIPRTKPSKKIWRYALELSLRTNFIARDIFLDGNTIRDSHSVQKNYITGEIGYGVDIAYKRWCLSYLRKHLTKEFKTQNRYHNYGSLIVSYQY